MPTPDEVVTAFITAIEQRDADAMLALVADGCEYDNVPIGPVHGPEGVDRILRPMIERSDEIEWRVLRSATSGNVVFNERIDRFRSGDHWIELPVTGVWEVVDGRITLWRDYFDLDTYRKQAQPRS